MKPLCGLSRLLAVFAGEVFGHEEGLGVGLTFLDVDQEGAVEVEIPRLVNLGGAAGSGHVAGRPQDDTGSAQGEIDRLKSCKDEIAS